MALAHDRNAIAHGERFALIMRDKDETDSYFALNALKFDLHCFAKLQVECRQRFVQQQRAWIIDKCTSKGNTLLLAARQLCWLSGCKLGKTHDLQHLHHACLDLLFVNFFASRTECNVVENGHVREECVLLKNSVHVSLIWRNR